MASLGLPAEVTRMRVLALHGRANLRRAHPGGEKIDRSAEALRAGHGPISFPPNEAPVQRHPDSGTDKSAGGAVFCAG